MWSAMRDWLKTGCLPADDQELADDLTAPEYGFDNRNRRQLEKKKDMNARGLTLIVVTHDPGVARRANRVLLMTDGRIARRLRGADLEPAPLAAPQPEPAG